MGTLTSVAHGGGQFVAVGGGFWDGNSRYIYASSDGLTWSNRLSGIYTGFSLHDVIYGNGQFVAVGNRGQIYTSADGLTWMPRVPPDTNIWFRSVAFGNETYVAVGTLNQGFVACQSFDGQNWSPPAVIASNRVPLKVAFGDGTFVAATVAYFVGGVPMLFSSADGATWQPRVTLQRYAGHQITGIAHGNGTFVAVGPTGLIFQTPDVRPHLQWQSCNDAPGCRRLVLNGYSNALYAVETSVDLNEWERCSTNRVFDTPTEVFTGSMTSPRSYYRAVLLPE
jgi:hypothetical protein